MSNDLIKYIHEHKDKFSNQFVSIMDEPEEDKRLLKVLLYLSHNRTVYRKEYKDIKKILRVVLSSNINKVLK